jgi:hypothetical protein
VDLGEPRWIFLNTLFSISAACMYMQLVDLLDAGRLDAHGSLGYADLYDRVQRTLDEAHMTGRLKREIIGNRDRFVDLDPEMPLALLDQKRAGKKLLLITNSEWSYAAPMLDYAFDAHLPGAMTWRDLFDIALVGARKPSFFSGTAPAFEVVSDDGLLRPHTGPLEAGTVYVGGHAGLVEESLGLEGDEILYVGDHLFVDVNVSKSVSRWRTALVVRELEGEIAALRRFAERQDRLSALMQKKEALEARYSALRLRLQRLRHAYGPPAAAATDADDATASEAPSNGAPSNNGAPGKGAPGNGAPGNGALDADAAPKAIEQRMKTLRDRLVALDEQIAPLARAASTLLNPNWGLLMRTGKDKSHFARQVERYADVYTSRVSNFLPHTPFVYLRSHRGNLPHDTAVEAYAAVEDRLHDAVPERG